MNIKDHVPSLELCKQLKEMGWIKTSFYWVKGVSGWQVIYGNRFPSDLEYYPAPLASEIGEELPTSIGHKYLVIRRGGVWTLEYKSFGGYSHRIVDDLEANARAKMWIYLKQNQLI